MVGPTSGTLFSRERARKTHLHVCFLCFECESYASSLVPSSLVLLADAHNTRIGPQRPGRPCLFASYLTGRVVLENGLVGGRGTHADRATQAHIDRSPLPPSPCKRTGEINSPRICATRVLGRTAEDGTLTPHRRIDTI